MKNSLTDSLDTSDYRKGVSGSPLDKQVSGNHYKDMTIQPITYILANEIPFCEGAVIKYVSRWRKKGGLADLEKARHFIDILIENEQS